MEYIKPSLEILNEEAINVEVVNDIEPGTAIVAGAGITTLAGIGAAIMSKGCW
jgi:hypothetical protein